MSEAFTKQHPADERLSPTIRRLSLSPQLAKPGELVQSWFRSGYSLLRTQPNGQATAIQAGTILAGNRRTNGLVTFWS